jgi:periplasmic protein TonB
LARSPGGVPKPPELLLLLELPFPEELELPEVLVPELPVLESELEVAPVLPALEPEVEPAPEEVIEVEPAPEPPVLDPEELEAIEPGPPPPLAAALELPDELDPILRSLDPVLGE